MEYIDNWTEHFEIFRNFSWAVLEQTPDWATIKNSLRIIGDLGSFDVSANSSAIFEQFGYVKNYCSNDKLKEWRTNKVKTDMRWVEIFSHMEAHHIPFAEFATMIEFILCLAGTSSPVERVFAKGKKIWKKESANLDVESLGLLLQVKCNMEWTCPDFFKFLKTRPDLLRKIGSQEKYDFKKPNANESAMSVQFDDDSESD